MSNDSVLKDNSNPCSGINGINGINGEEKNIIHEERESASPVKVKSNQSYPRTISSLDLAVQDIFQRRHCVEKLIPQGVTFLGGAPKSCKTIFVTQVAQAVGNGIKLFKYLDTKKSDVLMLSFEDDEMSIHNRLASMSPIYPPSPSVQIMWKWGASFDENMTYLENYLKDNPHTDLVIIDTFEKFCGSGKKRSYSGDYSVVGKIKTIADAHNTAILIVHHIIKTVRQNWMGAFYGTHGIAGSADSMLFLDRKMDTTVGKLYYAGRNIPDGSLDLKFNTKFLIWELSQSPPTLNLNPERRQIFDLLNSKKEMRLRDIADGVGKSITAVQNLLDKLIKLNLVVKTAHGVYAISPSLREQNDEAIENPVGSVEEVDSVDSMEIRQVRTEFVDLMDSVGSMDFRFLWS